MNIKDLRAVIIIRLEELHSVLDEKSVEFNEKEKMIKDYKDKTQELTEALVENKNQITELNRDIQLTNSIAERQRFRRRLTRLNISSREIRQNLNDLKVGRQRAEKTLEIFTTSLKLGEDKIAIYNQVITDLEEINDQELLKGIIYLIHKYQEFPETLDIFKRIINFIDFRIREHIDLQIAKVRDNPPNDLASFDECIERYYNYLETPNIPEVLSRIVTRFLRGIMAIRHPDLEQGLKVINSYKNKNPKWWYNDYKTVFGMYLPLRQQFGKIPQELEDLELVLNSMVEEIQDWEHEGKIRWIKTRAKDMFKLIEDYTRIYPQVTKFLNPINHHLSINE